MESNPYARHLGGRDAIAVMSETPSMLQSVLGQMTPDQIDQPPAPGKWSVREVLAHLADCEIVFGFRIRQALESPGCTVAPFDQDVWAKHYRAYTAETALHTFLSVRAWNLALVTTVSDTERSNQLSHPERGTFTLAVMLESIAGHDRNHLGRLQEHLRQIENATQGPGPASGL